MFATQKSGGDYEITKSNKGGANESFLEKYFGNCCVADCAAV